MVNLLSFTYGTTFIMTHPFSFASKYLFLFFLTFLLFITLSIYHGPKLSK